MLFKLALKNIRKSIKDYAIYFFTLVLGIAIFYVFNAMESSTAMVEMTTYQAQIVKLMNQVLAAISIFVSFVLGFLIIYASKFLMRRRKKEFAIYMMLGMGKRGVAKILLSETLLIGFISLGVGIASGVVASQFMSVLVAKLFEVDMSAYQFTFSIDATMKTLFYFTCIYTVVMIFSTISISRGKLIDLLNASRTNETIKIKKAWMSVALFLISIAILSYAYWKVTSNNYSDLNVFSMENIGIPIIMGCIGTFLFFYSLSGFILKLLQMNKNFYLRNLNMFVARQIHSKINTTVFSMSIITLMMFLTICILSSGISLNQAMTQNVKDLTPVDFQVSKTANLSEKSSDELIKYSNTSLKDDLKDMGFDTNKYLKNELKYSYYQYETITLRNILGDVANSTLKKYATLETTVDNEMNIMNSSEYNAIARDYHNQEIHLNENEYAIVADFEEMMNIYKQSLKIDTAIEIQGKTYTPKYQKCVEGFVEMGPNPMNTGIVIVPDSALNSSMIAETFLNANYNANNESERVKIEDILVKVSEEHLDLSFSRYINFNAITKLSIYESTIGLSVIITFIALYLGIIFLVSCAAILALKELSESNDNKHRYLILRKMGVDEKMINHSLFMQIAIFFLIPVALAIIHSVFGMEVAKMILAMFGKSDMLSSSTLAGIFILLIYGGYLLLTYICSKNIIKDNK